MAKFTADINVYFEADSLEVAGDTLTEKLRNVGIEIELNDGPDELEEEN